MNPLETAIDTAACLIQAEHIFAQKGVLNALDGTVAAEAIRHAPDPVVYAALSYVYAEYSGHDTRCIAAAGVATQGGMYGIGDYDVIVAFA